MVMRNISQAKAELSSLIKQVPRGNEVIISRSGRPVAKLVLYIRPSTARRAGALKGKIKISKDFDSLPKDSRVSLGMEA
jgi:antitoxin (DNA-binding transcriptional repressor) of toxin-antitoxin stability system